MRALLTGGQLHDSAPAVRLLGDLRPRRPVADRAYGSRAWRVHLAQRGT